ncbi:hypothetical protein DXG03_002289 [Asterophora parasitica]|uniref:Uncharacterized protein n=1 Tax=Asterophora parasitica TaxID=117018 RepID=A0A9P7G335_9AGAR|nr:hypothetical protein DXG03_002289 [Asterophora parasitica]
MSSEDEEKRPIDEKYLASESSLPSYEDAGVTTGAPVEKVSPLGYHVDSLTVIFLVGSSVLPSPPGSSLTPSIEASLAVYLEYASYFPHRSGAEVAYLEKVSHVWIQEPRHPLTQRSHAGLPEAEILIAYNICRAVGSVVVQ